MGASNPRKPLIQAMAWGSMWGKMWGKRGFVMASGMRKGKVPYLVTIRGVQTYERDFDPLISGLVEWEGKFPKHRIRKSLGTKDQAAAMIPYAAVHLAVEAAIDRAWAKVTPRRRRVDSMSTEEIINGLVTQVQVRAPSGGVDNLIEQFETSQRVELSPDLRERFRALAVDAANLAVRELMANPMNMANPANIYKAQDFVADNAQYIAPPPRVAMTLGQAIERFKTNPERGDLADNNLTNYTTPLEVLAEVLGESANVAYISRDDIMRVREIIRYLPSKAKNREGFREKTFTQIAGHVKAQVAAILREAEEEGWDLEEIHEALADIGVLKISSINKYLTNIGTIFEFFRVNGWISANPAERIRLDDSGYETKTQALPIEKLKKLFGPGYVYDGLGWLPVLSLYHGFRGNELAQMDLTDIQCVDGVWCFHVTPSVRVSHLVKSDKSTKSKKPRYVPIHSRVLALGFLAYVDRRRAEGQTKLFDAVKFASGNYYSSVKDAVRDIMAGVWSENHTFHSLRHNWQQCAEKAGIEEPMWKTLGGWSLPKSAADYYRAGVPVAALKDAIEKVSYPL